ncbi:hypothetical protein BKA82DRAFT_4362785 [Pisolithus tinctorius]|nr:hypothetical protein BKA82DRAFT_4362785 [Pisolithus tinctorius]
MHPLIHQASQHDGAPPLYGPYVPQDPIYTLQTSHLAASHYQPHLAQCPSPSQVTTTPIAQNCNPETIDNVGACISVSVPLNTGVIGGTVSHVQLHFATDIGFDDFFSHICAKMDLDLKEAELGYKYHTDWSNACKHLSRQVILEIHNLHKPTQATSMSRTSGTSWNVIATESLAEACAGSLGATQPSTTMTFASEFSKLKE